MANGSPRTHWKEWSELFPVDIVLAVVRCTPVQQLAINVPPLLSPCKWCTLTTTPQLQGELYAPRRRKRSAVTCSNRQTIAKHAAATVELGVVVLLAQQID